MSVIAFDTETHLIAPGLLAPPLVCLQWARPGLDACVVHRNYAKDIFSCWLQLPLALVGHNVAYDMGVIAAQWPDLLPAIFAKYDRNEVTDTLLREQLIMLAQGTFRSIPLANGDALPVKYSLDDCTARHFGRRLDKDTWRLRYREFDDVPDVSQWPEGARHYALEDARATLALFQSQERYAAVLGDQFRQARAAFALHLISCWGIQTDPDAVDVLEAKLLEEFQALTFELQQAALIRDDGTADTKAAMALMAQACAEEGFRLYMTPKGAVSLNAEACGQFTDDTGEPLDDVGDAGYTIGQYSKFLRVRKTLSNDIKMLKAGTGDEPVQARYDLAETGRTRASKPNIQAINRGEGIRECFRPREGKVFIQGDFEGLELHTLAVWCLEKIGRSAMADALNAGRDLHTDMAADMLGITYEEAIARKKAGDPVIKEYRQRAKAINFGLPGGLGAKKFVRYAKAQYGATLTEAEAVAAKALWLRKFPEMNEFFRLAAIATNNPSQLGDEAHLFTGRLRGNVRYSALCNGRFQGLGADAAKEALWRVTRACYVEPKSPLYGCRPVAFIHDEIIAECDPDRASAAAKELGRLMCEGANKYLDRVPVHVYPQIQTVWSKAAEPVFNEAGDLIPWAPP